MNTISVTRGFFCLLAATAIFSCQKEDVKPSITLQDDSYLNLVFLKAGGSQTISFTSVLDWSVKSSADWLTPDKDSGGDGQNSLTLTASANKTYDERSATITLRSESRSTTLIKTIYVSQFKTEALSASPSTVSVSYNGGDFKIKVNSNVDYTVSTSDSWITRCNETKALEDSTITFKASSNWSGNSRSAVISFNASDTYLTAKVEVIQDANPNPGSGEETPFTMNCKEIGAYTSTGGESPIRTTTYSDYQHAYGTQSGGVFLHFTDFENNSFTMLSLSAETLSIGAEYTLITSCGDNGDMMEKSSERVQLISQKEGKIWLEDKSTGTGYIIPAE